MAFPVYKKHLNMLDDKPEDFFDEMLERMAGGLGIYKQAQQIGVPYSALMSWIRMDEDRNERFVKCEVMYAQKLVEESMEIADAATNEDGFVAKLKIDTRLRIAGKLDARFGNGPSVAVTGTNVQVVMTDFGDRTKPGGEDDFDRVRGLLEAE